MVWGTVGRSTLVVIGVVGTILAMPFIKGGKKIENSKRVGGVGAFKGEVPEYIYSYTIKDISIVSNRQTFTGLDAITTLRDNGAENIRIEFVEKVDYKYHPLDSDGSVIKAEDGSNPKASDDIVLFSDSGVIKDYQKVAEIPVDQFIQYGFSHRVKRNNYQLVKESMIKSGHTSTNYLGVSRQVRKINTTLEARILVDLSGDDYAIPSRTQMRNVNVQYWPVVGPNHTGKFEEELR